MGLCQPLSQVRWSVKAWRARAIVAPICCWLLCAGLARAEWRAGAAAEVITPPWPMPMAGYASRGAQHATGRLTDLYAKALVLQDEWGERGVLVTLDLVGLERTHAADICRALQADHGLRRDQVVLACSHTHTGPVVARNLRPMHYLLFDAADRGLVDRYAAYLRSQVRAVVSRAVHALAPAEISHGAGVATFAVNRRNNPEVEVPQRRAEGRLRGPVDHAVPVLAVRQGERLVAAVFGYACHCTVLGSSEWSGDYAGFAQANIEAANPGCVAMFWAGCGADQNPLPRKTTELAREYGHDLAAAVERVLAQEMSPVSAQFAATYAEIDLKFGELPSREALAAETASKNEYIAARARSLLEQIDAGQPLSATYPYPVTTWRLGHEIVWVFLGGEVVVDYALRIKADLSRGGESSSPPWITAYAQDVMAYIPSRRVLTEGGYEGGGAMVYYGLPTVWSGEVEEQVITEVHRQLITRP